MNSSFWPYGSRDRLDTEPITSPEKAEKIRVVRQAFALAHFLYEYAHTKEPYRVDPETNRVRFEGHTIWENLKKIGGIFGSPNPAANSTTESILELAVSKKNTISFIRREDDYADAPHPPSISFDDNPAEARSLFRDFLQEQINPQPQSIDEFLDGLEVSPKRRLESRRYELTLIPKGPNFSATISTKQEVIGPNGETIQDIRQHRNEILDVTTHPLYKSIAAFRLNAIEQIRSMLKSAIQHPHSLYAERLDETVKKQIFQLIMNEFQAQQAFPQSEFTHSDVKLERRRIEGENRLFIEYSIQQVGAKRNGRIQVHYARISQPLDDSPFRDEIRVSDSEDPLLDFNQWLQNQKKDRKEFTQRIELEISRLADKLVKNTPGIFGNSKKVSISPRTGHYELLHVDQPDSSSSEGPVKTIIENPSNPGVEELLFLTNLLV